MPTPLPHPVRFTTILATSYTAGAGSLVLQSGDGGRIGALAANEVYAITAVTSPGPGETIVCNFRATGLSTDTLTGVTSDGEIADANVASGTPLQVRVTKTWQAALQGAVQSLEKVYLSRSVTSDAAGAIGYGATAPSGTDRTASVQAAIDAAIAAYPSGVTVAWDVAVGLSAPILLPSGVTIEAPSWGCGAIMRAASNCPMFRLAGQATDATTSKQNSFGKLDPDHAGNATYRVYDLAYINNRDITIRGGTWNGNRDAQTGTIFTSTYGFPAIFQGYGCWNVTLEDCQIFSGISAIAVHFANWDNLTLNRVNIDGSPLPSLANLTNPLYAKGGIQLNGPAGPVGARITDSVTHCSDDPIAVNSDDSDASAINSSYAGGNSYCTPGVNWPCCGPIPLVVVEGHRYGRGVEDVDGFCASRILSTVSRVGKVVYRGSSGTVRGLGHHWGPFGSTIQLTGPGNIGSIEVIDDSTQFVDPVNDGFYGTAFYESRGTVESIRITNRRRGDLQASPVPDVRLCDIDGNSPSVGSLVVTGDYDSTTTNAAAQVKVSVPVDLVYIATRCLAPSGTASPALLTATGADIGKVVFDGIADGPTNLIEHAAGAIETVIARGLHADAGGGSPLAVATGLTVKNAWYKDLAYNHGSVQFKSGSGVVTNDNDYVEVTATVYAEDTFVGTNGDLIAGRTPAPTSPGHNWATFEGTSSLHTIQSNAARLVSTAGAEGVSLDCGQADGELTVTGTLGATGGTGLGLVFRATGNVNYFVVWVNGSGYVTLYKSGVAQGTDYPITVDLAPHTIKASFLGSAINIYYDGILTHTITDGFNATATIHGFRCYANTATFDNFKLTS